MVYTLNGKYGTYKVIIAERSYANNRLALEILDCEDGIPVMVATVNIPEVPLNEGEIIVKNYSENEGVLDFLQQNGLVGEVLREVQTGFVKCPIVRYLGLPK
jgi:hypothetical protein